MAEGHVPSGSNRLLSALPVDYYSTIAHHLEFVTLKLRENLYESHKLIEYVYFPVNGVVSMLAEMEEGEQLVEVATVGNEGMIGLPLFLGASMTPGISFSQIPGDALRMSAPSFLAAIHDGPHLTSILHRYTQALMTQISQSTACNRAHSDEHRCARWLLLSHDRVGADEFLLTQEFLGQMLGVLQATVIDVTGKFQAAGLIEYSEDLIRILNRRGLENASCHCYRVIRTEYDRLLGD